MIENLDGLLLQIKDALDKSEETRELEQRFNTHYKFKIKNRRRLK